MPQRQLNIRSDEAVDRADSIAKRLGKTTTDVVIEALRSFEERCAPLDELGMTPSQRADYEALRVLSKETSKHELPGVTSDHGWLYDERGLPR